MRLAPILLIALTLGLAACAPSAPESGAADAPAPGTALWFEPAALKACGSGREVLTVHWDTSAHPDVKGVQVVALESDGKEGLFADVAGTQGSKDTGPWMAAGKTMVLRNAADGTELARTSVKSIPCP